MRQLSVVLLSALFIVITGSCATQSSATKAEEAVVGPPDVSWKNMTKKQKGKFMKAKVMPHMEKLFQEFDAKEFAKFECATCHGEGAKEETFKMPNKDIEILPATSEGFGKLMNEKPEWMKFMGEKVKPQMAELLGLESFNPKDPKPGAFSCTNCHTTQKQ